MIYVSFHYKQKNLLPFPSLSGKRLGPSKPGGTEKGCNEQPWLNRKASFKS